MTGPRCLTECDLESVQATSKRLMVSLFKLALKGGPPWGELWKGQGGAGPDPGARPAAGGTDRGTTDSGPGIGGGSCKWKRRSRQREDSLSFVDLMYFISFYLVIFPHSTEPSNGGGWCPSNSSSSAWRTARLKWKGEWWMTNNSNYQLMGSLCIALLYISSLLYFLCDLCICYLLSI